MRNEYIPYTEAKILEELGFDEPCIYVYLDRDTVRQNHGFMNYPKEIYSGAIKTPLYQQAFRWFREKHNLCFYIESPYHKSKKWRYSIEIEDLNNPYINSDYYLLYEDAELECLKKLIEIAQKTIKQ